MRVAFVILSLLSLLSFAPNPASAQTSTGGGLLKFATRTVEAPWPGRRQAFVRQLTTSVTFTTSTGTRPTYNSPLLLTGGFVPDWVDDYNDVWLSNDNGRTWTLAAGVTADGESNNGAAAETSFPTAKNNGANFAVLPTTGAIVRISQDVYSTNNVVTWNPVTPGNYPYEQRNIPTLVATSRGTLIRAAGQDADGAFRNDVVISVDGGRNWRVATENAAWSARFVNTMLTIPSAIGGGKDITYVIAGRDEYDNSNDVWASSDSGVTWAMINPKAPFMTRASANGAVTRDGLLILAGGFADNDPGRSNTNVANDVWLSMDGGYTWGLCVLDADWDDRFQQAVVIDTDGHLLVMSGATGDVDASVVLNDVWRSLTSFHDLPTIARTCGLTVPSCGTGLKCWPGADTVVATDGSFVSCSACPTYSSSASNTNTTALIAALAAFVILFVVAAVAAGYLWNKWQASKAGGPASYAGTSFASADTAGLIGSDHQRL